MSKKPKPSKKLTVLAYIQIKFPGFDISLADIGDPIFKPAEGYPYEIKKKLPGRYSIFFSSHRNNCLRGIDLPDYYVTVTSINYMWDLGGTYPFNDKPARVYFRGPHVIESFMAPWSNLPKNRLVKIYPELMDNHPITSDGMIFIVDKLQKHCISARSIDGSEYIPDEIKESMMFL
jgi:hypothetical protein